MQNDTHAPTRFTPLLISGVACGCWCANPAIPKMPSVLFCNSMTIGALAEKFFPN